VLTAFIDIRTAGIDLGACPPAHTLAGGVPPTRSRRAGARAAWIEWLAAAHPELGITADTEWKPVFVSTLLVVSHYSYWSEDWEVTVAWHNMIPPDDWTEVHLRRRGVDTAPSLAWRRDPHGRSALLGPPRP
jgi:hypothetical protein